MTGWVADAKQDFFLVNNTSRKTVEIGERILASVSMLTATAIFHAYVLRQTDEGIWMKVDGGINQCALQEEARILFPLAVSLQFGEEAMDAEVTDISRSGMGLIASKELESGSIVTINAGSGPTQITLQCEVRYCRKNGDLDSYRSGLMIVQCDRLSRARWDVLLHRGEPIFSVAEAAEDSKAA